MSCGNSTSHLTEIIIALGKFGILHAKYHVLLHMPTHRNEVIIEQYHIYGITYF